MDYGVIDEDPKTKTRYDNLISQFNSNYATTPQFIARSPGRVNLIGDHIDYCYFSVLPMALDADVIVAVSTNNTNTITLSNTNKQFQQETFQLPSDGSVIEIDQSNFSWVNYFKCGLIVAHKFILENHPSLLKSNLKGLNLLFDGNVPTGGGLSSSAAFCVASTLAVLKANGVDSISKHDLTKITVVSEHYVGVNTGGMDQCASIYGEQNKALLIQFKPELIGIPFQLPILKPYDMVFLITNSLVSANKHETAPINYNLRAVEAAVSAEFLAKKFNLSLVQDSNLSTGSLRGFMDDYFEKIENKPHWDGQDIYLGIERLSKLMELIEIEFNNDEKLGFTTEMAANSLNLSIDQFHSKFLNKFPVEYSKLKLYQRTKHIFDLLNQSQLSNKNLIENSKPKCDELCQIALENGSYGSRVTGAGFGGSCVHLTTFDKLPKLIKAIEVEYYQKNFPNLSKNELKQVILVSKPATGSCIVEL
ncbi:unnamed protein product [Wickerhamomyces anomalus]